MRTLTQVSMLILLLPGLALAAAGDPDPTFVYPAPVVLEPDSTNLVDVTGGWIVVKSRLPFPPAANATLELARIDENGAPVAAYGANGRRTVVLPGRLNVSVAATRLDDNSLLLGGFKQVDSVDGSVPVMVRLSAAGDLDTTFGDGGVVVLDVQGQFDRVAEIQQLFDGRLAVLVWSTEQDLTLGCRGRTALWYLSGDGRQREEVSAIVGACGTAVTLKAGWDDQDVYRVLWGSDNGIRDGAVPYRETAGRYGPFTFFWYWPLFYSLIVDVPLPGPIYADNESPNQLQLVGGPLPAGSNSTVSAGYLAGFSTDEITWTKLELGPGSLPLLYAGFSTVDGRVAIARLRSDGRLDASWGRGRGVAVVEGAGRSGATGRDGQGGPVKDLRYLGRFDQGLVVATADGVIQRLTEIQVASIQVNLRAVSVTRSQRVVSVSVSRVGIATGKVSVQYVVVGAGCGVPLCAESHTAAQAGEDYAAQSGELTWDDGDLSDKVINIQILAPATPQPREALTIELFNVVGNAVAYDGQAPNRILLAESSGSTPPPGPSSSNGGGGAVDLWTLLLSLLLLPVGLRCCTGPARPW